MANKPYKPCGHTGCPELTREAYCEKHKPQKAPKRYSGEYAYLYKTTKWRMKRAEHLLKEPYCRECIREGKGRVRGEEVDHIIPHRGNNELFWNENNWQTLCKHHHSQKTIREAIPPGRKSSILDQNRPPTPTGV